MAVRVMAQWSLTYGLMLLGLKQAARHGNLDARLLVRVSAKSLGDAEGD